MNARGLLLVPLLSLVAVGGCSKRAPEPEAQSTKPATTGAPATSAPSSSTTELAWDVPASFKLSPKQSPMRKATYELPKDPKDAEAPELSVSVAGGSVDANIDRWVSQFDPEAKKTLVRTTKKVGPWDVTTVEIHGAMVSGMMGGPAPTPKPGFALRAAIVPVGNQSWFFKATGPAASIDASKKDFDAMIASLRPKS